MDGILSTEYLKYGNEKLLEVSNKRYYITFNNI